MNDILKEALEIARDDLKSAMEKIESIHEINTMFSVEKSVVSLIGKRGTQDKLNQKQIGLVVGIISSGVSRGYPPTGVHGRHAVVVAKRFNTIEAYNDNLIWGLAEGEQFRELYEFTDEVAISETQKVAVAEHFATKEGARNYPYTAMRFLENFHLLPSLKYRIRVNTGLN